LDSLLLNCASTIISAHQHQISKESFCTPTKQEKKQELKISDILYFREIGSKLSDWILTVTMTQGDKIIFSESFACEES